MLPESRRYPRRRVELTARLACLDPDRDERTGGSVYRMMTVRTVDVSDGGMAVQAEEGFGSGRRVVVELDLPDGRTVEVSGRIVWLELPTNGLRSDARMGIEFGELSAGLAQTVV
jgi:Tfp pilus assembly protein PilZ